jgi:two-component system, LytTR family, sensor histidine kinase AlgZ
MHDRPRGRTEIRDFCSGLRYSARCGNLAGWIGTLDQFSTTLRAVAAPRRLAPITLVTLALALVQVYYSGDPRSVFVPITLAIAFTTLGPWSWRQLVARGRAPALGGALYATGAIVAVALLGVGLPRLIHLGATFLTDPGSLLVAVVLYLVGGWGLGRDIELELDLEHSRLQAIRSHLDPHFLYNTLNAIAEWCAEDPRVAEEAILRLASMLRDLLDGLERRVWPLARELALTEDFLELHRIRDPDTFTIGLAIDEAATTAEVPPLLLLSLAENAVKHGPRLGHRGAIDIRVSAAGPRIRLEIENPGPFRPGGEPGRGLITLRARLALLFGSHARLEMLEVADDRTRATVELPSRST